MTARTAFTENLRRKRERRGIGLEAIAARTKVSASLFAALERGDCTRWPTGIYARAYVRAYAEAVGLDPDGTAREFGEHFPEIAWPDRPAAAPAAGAERVGPAAAGPLRLSLAEPAARPRSPLLRLAGIAIELLAMLAVATLVVVVGSADLWMTLSIVSLTNYVLVRSSLPPRNPGDQVTDPRAGDPVSWFGRRLSAARASRDRQVPTAGSA